MRNTLALLLAVSTMRVAAYGGDSALARAPELEGGLGWLNVKAPVTLRDLRGKIVLFDFWTYCCINCMQALPDLKRLEVKFPKELAVIGVHSAKFDNEKDTGHIRQAVLRHEISHPVVNDAELRLWKAYDVHAWPTLVVIDPEGRIAGRFSGEGHYEELSGLISGLAQKYKAKGLLNDRPLALALERDALKPSPLSYPGKVITDPVQKRVFIADTNHNRVVIADFNGKVLDVMGSGLTGSMDGPFEKASFDHPQGMALDGDMLYIADTENQRVRRADLKARFVLSLSQPLPSLGSPWDLASHDGGLYIAMAGKHQIWYFDRRLERPFAFAGSGEERLSDGSPASAALAQPSGLAAGPQALFIADSEASAVREIDFSAPSVRTLVGRGLFDFGDRDGIGEEVRLQHPLGLAYHDGRVFIADTYNHKIKVLDPKTREVRTLADGFLEPGGLAVLGDRLLVADTDHHALVTLSFDGKERAPFVLKGLKAPPAAPPTPPMPEPDETILPWAKVRSGAEDAIILDVHVPPSYHINPGAPFLYRIAETRGVINFIPAKRKGLLASPKLPISIPFRAPPGKCEALLSVNFYYCRTDNKGLCLAKTGLYRLPIEAAPGERARKIPVTVTAD